MYTPKLGNGPFPVIIYYHGGGWVIFGMAIIVPEAKEARLT